MEGVTPPLSLALTVRRSLMQGLSVRKGVQEYLSNEEDEFAILVSRWNFLMQNQRKQEARDLFKDSSSFRQQLMSLFERGVDGEPINEALNQFIEELQRASMQDLDSFLRRLPYILMIPLFLFQLPALMALLFGPVLANFFHSLGGQ